MVCMFVFLLISNTIYKIYHANLGWPLSNSFSIVSFWYFALCLKWALNKYIKFNNFNAESGRLNGFKEFFSSNRKRYLFEYKINYELNFKIVGCWLLKTFK